MAGLAGELTRSIARRLGRNGSSSRRLFVGTATSWSSDQTSGRCVVSSAQRVLSIAEVRFFACSLFGIVQEGEYSWRS